MYGGNVFNNFRTKDIFDNKNSEWNETEFLMSGVPITNEKERERGIMTCEM